MTDAKAPPAPKLSATVLLVRDGSDGLEVFMVERHHQIDFATGALVFPGGKVDVADGDQRVLAACRGIDGLRPDEITARVAAIRETFEEAGVLLARGVGDDALICAARLAEIDTRHREALHAGERSLGDVLDEESLELACDLLVPFAHWITPEFMPKRFDTHFFLAVAPEDQLALHDGFESVDSVWTRVEDALEAARSGRRTVIFPTRLNLGKLGRSSDVASAVDAARRDPIVTVLPTLGRDENGESVVRIPESAGYDLSQAVIDDIMR